MEPRQDTFAHFAVKFDLTLKILKDGLLPPNEVRSDASDRDAARLLLDLIHLHNHQRLDFLKAILDNTLLIDGKNELLGRRQLLGYDAQSGVVLVPHQ